MNARVLRMLGLAAAFAASMLTSSPAAGQHCECTHQGTSVDCPAGLPPGSRSVQFVPGGTTWVTPSGQSVFVPHASFACASSVQHPKTTSLQGPIEPQSGGRKDSRDRSHGFELVGELGHDIGKQPRDSFRVTSPGCNSQSCGSHLKDDPALMCYRHVSASLVDSHGVVHQGSLYDQLRMATGIQHAQIQQPGKQTPWMNDSAYDCAGTFYDRDGKPIHVPAFPSDAKSDADVKDWKTGVANFFLGAYVDLRGNKLSLGQADLCTEWAGIYFQAKPDPSVLNALDTLQRLGAESATEQDTPWLRRIVDAGSANSCPTLPLPVHHDMDSWVVPAESARSFHRAFRDCSAPDPNRVGGCPHAFDARTGNHVNVQHLLDIETTRGAAASWFVGDEPPPCGIDCYRQSGQRAPVVSGRSLSRPTSRDADADCTAAVNGCLRTCESSNVALSNQCIDLGGSPSGGMCTANVDKCSCTQTAPECKRR
jgi:hypothetical protein